MKWRHTCKKEDNDNEDNCDDDYTGYQPSLDMWYLTYYNIVGFICSDVDVR